MAQQQPYDWQNDHSMQVSIQTILQVDTCIKFCSRETKSRSEQKKPVRAWVGYRKWLRLQISDCGLKPRWACPWYAADILCLCNNHDSRCADAAEHVSAAQFTVAISAAAAVPAAAAAAAAAADDTFGWIRQGSGRLAKERENHLYPVGSSDKACSRPTPGSIVLGFAPILAKSPTWNSHVRCSF